MKPPRPATSRQLALLSEFGITTPRGMTRGEAYRAIEAELARRRTSPATARQRRALAALGVELPADATTHDAHAEFGRLRAQQTDPPSKKQRALLEQLGVAVPATAGAASLAIDNKLHALRIHKRRLAAG